MKLTDAELDKIMDEAGLELAEPYSPRGSYAKNGWLLTRCKHCGTLAHYRLAYVLEKNGVGEPTCRTCFWLGWYDWSHEITAQNVQWHLDRGYELDYLLDNGIVPNHHNLSWDEARAHAAKHGYDLVGLVHGKRPGDNVMVVRCCACGRQTAERPEDVSFGCTCAGKGPGKNVYVSPDDALPPRGEVPSWTVLDPDAFDRFAEALERPSSPTLEKFVNQKTI